MATYETAENTFITANGIKHAYQLFSQTTGTSLFLHIHFRGNMDWWDPAFINPLAAKRPILLVDNTGVGHGEGTVSTRYVDWAQTIIDVAKALNIPKLDVGGFSMGGFVVQRIALQAPNPVRKLIIMGSGPSAVEGVVAGDPKYFVEIASGTSLDEWHKSMKPSFFSHLEKKQALAEEWLQRIDNLRPNRVPMLAAEGLQNQIATVQRWSSDAFRDKGS